MCPKNTFQYMHKTLSLFVKKNPYTKNDTNNKRGKQKKHSGYLDEEKYEEEREMRNTRKTQTGYPISRINDTSSLATGR